MSTVPRWGALSFEEKIENDMVIHRMKDIHQPPHKKDFVKINKLPEKLLLNKHENKDIPRSPSKE